MGKRLLFHCVVNKSHYPWLTVEDFAKWDLEEVLDALGWWGELSPGHQRTRYSPEEAGLEEIGLEEGKGERLLEEEGDSVTPQLGGEIQDPSIEAEPVKPRRGWNEEDEEEKRSGSPELAKLSGEKEKEVRRNDVDEEESQSQQGETPVVAGGTDKPRNPGSSDS